ncbi:MAG TPA: glycosyltransferase family 39 protein [Polyangiaceae bacterium]|jgi:4-amino-4-deoxy-L-arabinose transferase-like glycosyltransferase|nr:glycosyltransferase family 39 protein [Polyangiaceae bacterium]
MRGPTERELGLGGLVLLLASAAAWWVGFLWRDAPFVFHPDEPSIMARALGVAGTGELDPHWFRYPSLYIYLESILATLVHAFTRIPMAPGARLLFEGAVPEVVTYYVVGRALTVAFALGTTFLVVKTAERVAGRWASLFAGAVFATSLLVQKSAATITVDMALTFFVALTICLLARAIDTGRASLRTFIPTAVAGGLAAGAKYNGALILLVVGVVFLVMNGPRRLRSYLGVAALAIVSIVVFVVTTPYAVLAPREFLDREDGFTAELIHYSTGHFGADTGSSAHKMFDTLSQMVGPFAFLGLGSLVAVVLGAMPRRLRPTLGMLVASMVVMAAPVVIAKVYFLRNCLPLVPPALALGAAFVTWVASRLDRAVESRPPALRYAARAAIVTAVVGIQSAEAARTILPEVAARAFVDPRIRAHEWFLDHVPPGSRVLREAFTPHLHLSNSFTVDSVFSVGQIPVSTLERYDYVVTGSALLGAFPDLSKTTYGWLFARTPLHEELPPPIPDFMDWPAVRIDQLSTPKQSNARPRSVFRLSTSDGFAGVSPVLDVQLDSPPAGHDGPLTIEATGPDPSLLLPRVRRRGTASYVVRIRLESPLATIVQLFYATHAAPKFNEEHSVKQPLSAGENRVELRFEAEDLQGRLRLDPGTAPGRYVLDSVELLALP